MHAHERTLLSSMGFTDPDKREPLHDRACQYLSTPEVAWKIAEKAFADKVGGESTAKITSVSAQFEVALSKGEDRYKQTIGFLDLVLDVRMKEARFIGEIVVEVKIIPVGAGDILRQIHLYREHLRFSDRVDAIRWVVVTAFDVAAPDAAMLRSSGITLLRLGQSFTDWVAEQERLKACGDGVAAVAVEVI